MDRLGEGPRIVEVGVRGFPPDEVGVFGKGEAAGDAMIETRAFAQPVEAFGGALTGDELPVALIDVRGDQLGAFGVGPGDQHRRGAANVGGEARRVEIANGGLGRDQHLAAQMAALFLGCELILEVDACGTRLDIGLHDLEAVERAAKTRFGVGDDRNEPVALGAAFEMFDLVGALERAIDPAGELGPGIGRVERLVGIHGAGGVGIGGDLPAGQVDRLETGANLLHRLVAGDRTERADGLVLTLEQLPQFLGAATGEGVVDGDRTAQPLDLIRVVGTGDSVETTGGCGNELVKTCHRGLRVEMRLISDRNDDRSEIAPANKAQLS